MKIGRSRQALILLLIVLSVMWFGGCSKSGLVGNTYVEPELTVDYLTADYAQQLIRDGADKKFGKIENIIDNGDGSYMITVDEKQFVTDMNQPNGFYIADRNLTYDLYLASNARTVFYPGGDSAKAVFYEHPKQFLDALQADRTEFGASNPDYQDFQLFYFYVMKNEVVLVTQQYIP